MSSRTDTAPALGFLSGMRAVFRLEMKQRLRSRGWYVLLAVWFVVIGLVAVLTAVNSASDVGPPGSVLYELMVGFVLFFGLLLAPALSANAVNGDRAAGTLAIQQVTLLRPGHLLAGKWLAAWTASLAFLLLSVPFLIWALALGGVSAGTAVVSVVMLALELAVVCAIGVGISTLANRPLFSIVVSYMVVALLGLGTLIAYGLSFTLTEGTVRASMPSYAHPVFTDEGAEFDPNDYTCSGPVLDYPAYHTERTTWILAANPFVIVADAIPSNRDDLQRGLMEEISSSVRASQAGPEYTVPCFNGEKQAGLPQVLPIWPLGLFLQAALAAVLVFGARRRLSTPAGRLPAGSRIA